MGLRPHQVTAMGIARTFQNIRLWSNLTVLDNLRMAQHYNLGYGLMDIFFHTPRFDPGGKRNQPYRPEDAETLGPCKIMERNWSGTSPTACSAKSRLPGP